MLFNYLKIAFRILTRNKLVSTILPMVGVITDPCDFNLSLHPFLDAKMDIIDKHDKVRSVKA